MWFKQSLSDGAKKRAAIRKQQNGAQTSFGAKINFDFVIVLGCRFSMLWPLINVANSSTTSATSSHDSNC